MNYVQLATTLGIKGIAQANEFRARCPLHDDQNPSFSLNIHTGLWICHRGCGQGEFTALVEQILNCSSQEAREWIESNGQRSTVEHLTNTLADQLLVSVFDKTSIDTDYHSEGWRTYFDSLANEHMPVWFMNRGFTWDTIQHWNLRYDIVRDAVVIPVYWKEELLGIISRNAKFSDRPKYENSYGLPKASILFGEISKSSSLIIICEGVLDAIWLWQCNFNAAALLGSSISRRQIEILREYRFGEVVLALDNDQAGSIGTEETIGKLTKAGWLLPQINILRFPNNRKDPQDCSKEELTELFNNKKDVFA